MMELLSPAGSREALVAAVHSGADAVYLGGQALNARRGAQNFDADGLCWAADYCHERGAKVYVTVNTLVKHRELGELSALADQLARAGVDAAIVQDLGVARALSEMLPSLALHASTQMALHNRQGVALARSLGMRRAVLARELPLEEIARCAREGLELEVFVHGALCVSCSGQCLFSSLVGGRSGNRGLCAQPCRLPYRLEAGELEAQGYLLSPKDLMALNYLDQLKRAGVHSLKIEGRLKRPEYVQVVTSIYREALDRLEAGEPPAPGEDEIRALRQIFNRGGFTQGYGPGLVDRELMSPLRPNHMGVEVGRVLKAGGGSALYQLSLSVSAADALVIRPRAGEDLPIRAPSGEAGGRYTVRVAAGAQVGDAVVRLTEAEQLHSAQRAMETERPRVALSARLTARLGQPLSLELCDGVRRGSASGAPVEPAQKACASPARVAQQLQKTGGTPYEIQTLELDLDEAAFLPASALNELRRAALASLGGQRRDQLRGCERTARPLSAVPRYPHAPLVAPVGTCLAVESSDLSLLEAALGWGAQLTYYRPTDCSRKALETQLPRLRAIRPLLALPMVLPSQALSELNEWSLSHGEALGGVLLTNPGQLALEWPGQRVGGFSLNVMNRLCAGTLLERGLDRITPSVELTAQEIREMELQEGALELVAYGRLPLMQLRHCPVRAQTDGAHGDCRKCGGAPMVSGGAQLIDRKGARFPLARYRAGTGCVVEVLNSVPLMLLRQAHRLPPAAVWRLRLTEESRSQAERLVRLHAAALSGTDIRQSELWRELEEMPSTTGHFFRGVE